jgi:hypothetical protein
MKHWRIDEVPWDQFERAKTAPEVVAIVKAAAMVERNGIDYATYLKNVFHDDPAFRQAADNWSFEEVQHGMALGQWAMLADPKWDFETSFKRYKDGFKLPLALHGRNRHVQLLHGPCRGHRRAGAEAHMSSDRGRRVPAFQTVL